MKISKIIPRIISVMLIVICMTALTVQATNSNTFTSNETAGKSSNAGFMLGTDVTYRIGLAVLSPDASNAANSNLAGSDAWFNGAIDYARTHYVACDGTAFHLGNDSFTGRGEHLYHVDNTSIIGRALTTMIQNNETNEQNFFLGTNSNDGNNVPDLMDAFEAVGDDYTTGMVEMWREQQLGADASNPVVIVVEAQLEDTNGHFNSASDMLVKCGGNYQQLRSSLTTIDQLFTTPPTNNTSATDNIIAKLCGYYDGIEAKGNTWPYRWTKRFFATDWSEARPSAMTSSTRTRVAANVYPRHAALTTGMNGYRIYPIHGKTEHSRDMDLPVAEYHWDLAALDNGTIRQDDTILRSNNSTGNITGNKLTNINFKQSNYNDWVAYCNNYPNYTYDLVMKYTGTGTNSSSTDSNSGKFSTQLSTYKNTVDAGKLVTYDVNANGLIVYPLPVSARDGISLSSKYIGLTKDELLTYFREGTSMSTTNTFTVNGTTKFNGRFEYCLATECNLRVHRPGRSDINYYMPNRQMHYIIYDHNVSNTYMYTQALESNMEIKSNAGHWASNNDNNNSTGLGNHYNNPDTVYNTMTGIPTTSDVYITQGGYDWLVQIQYLYAKGDYTHTINVAADRRVHNYYYYTLGHADKWIEGQGQVDSGWKGWYRSWSGIYGEGIKILAIHADATYQKYLSALDQVKANSWWDGWCKQGNYPIKMKSNDEIYAAVMAEQYRTCPGHIKPWDPEITRDWFWDITCMEPEQFEGHSGSSVRFEVFYQPNWEFDKIIQGYDPVSHTDTNSDGSTTTWIEMVPYGIARYQFNERWHFDWYRGWENEVAWVEPPSATWTQTYKDITYLDIVECNVSNVGGGQEDGMAEYLANHTDEVLNLACDALGYEYYNAGSCSMTYSGGDPATRNSSSGIQTVKGSTPYSWIFDSHGLARSQRLLNEMNTDIYNQLAAALDGYVTYSDQDTINIRYNPELFGGRSCKSEKAAFNSFISKLFADKGAHIAVADDVLRVKTSEGKYIDYCGGTGFTTGDSMFKSIYNGNQWILATNGSCDSGNATGHTYAEKPSHPHKNDGRYPEDYKGIPNDMPFSSWSINLSDCQGYNESRSIARIAQGPTSHTFYNTGVGSNNVETSLNISDTRGPHYSGFLGYERTIQIPSRTYEAGYVGKQQGSGTYRITDHVSNKTPAQLGFVNNEATWPLKLTYYPGKAATLNTTAGFVNTTKAPNKFYPSAVNLNLKRTLSNGTKDTGDAALYYVNDINYPLISGLVGKTIRTIAIKEGYDTRNRKLARKQNCQIPNTNGVNYSIAVPSTYRNNTMAKNDARYTAATRNSSFSEPNDIVIYNPVTTEDSRVIESTLLVSDGQGNLERSNDPTQSTILGIRDQRIGDVGAVDVGGSEYILGPSDYVEAELPTIRQNVYIKKSVPTNAYVYNDYDLYASDELEGQIKPDEVVTFTNSEGFDEEVRASLFGDSTSTANNVAFIAKNTDQFAFRYKGLYRLPVGDDYTISAVNNNESENVQSKGFNYSQIEDLLFADLVDPEGTGEVTISVNQAVRSGDVFKFSLGNSNADTFELLIDGNPITALEDTVNTQWIKEGDYYFLYLEFKTNYAVNEFNLITYKSIEAPYDAILMQHEETYIFGMGNVVASTDTGVPETSVERIDQLLNHSNRLQTSYNPLVADYWPSSGGHVGPANSNTINYVRSRNGGYSMELREDAITPHKVPNANWRYYITGRFTKIGNVIKSPDDMLLSNPNLVFPSNYNDFTDTVYLKDLYNTSTGVIVNTGSGYQLSTEDLVNAGGGSIYGSAGSLVKFQHDMAKANIHTLEEPNGVTYPLTIGRGWFDGIYSSYFKLSNDSNWKTANKPLFDVNYQEGTLSKDMSLDPVYYYAPSSSKWSVDWDVQEMDVESAFTRNILNSGEFISLDDQFAIYFPNITDAKGADNKLFIPEVESNTSDKYTDSMNVTYWLKEKTVTFPFDVYCNKNPNQPIHITSQADADALVFYEANTPIHLGKYTSTYSSFSDDGLVFHHSTTTPAPEVLDPDTLTEYTTVDEADNANHFFDYGMNGRDGNGSGGGDMWTYYFYIPLEAGEARGAEILCSAKAVNDGGLCNEYINNYDSPKRNSVFGDARNRIPVNIVGRMGGLTMVDTGDFRWQETFKNTDPDNWTVFGLIHSLKQYMNTDDKFDSGIPNLATQNNVVMDPWDVRGRLTEVFSAFGPTWYQYYAHSSRGNNTYGTQWFKDVQTDWYDKCYSTQSPDPDPVSTTKVSLPLVPRYNVIESLKTTPLRLGYSQYLSLESIGNYYGFDSELSDDYDSNVVNINGDEGQYKVQIRPVYFDIAVGDDGSTEVNPVDVYSVTADGKYDLINTNLYGGTGNSVNVYAHNSFYEYSKTNDKANLPFEGWSKPNDQHDGARTDNTYDITNNNGYSLSELMLRKLVTPLENKNTYSFIQRENSTIFNQLTRNTDHTTTANDSPTRIELMSRVIGLNDAQLRDYLTVNAMNKFGFDSSMLMDFQTYGTNTYAMGNAQYLMLRARNRTYIGGSSVYLFNRDTWNKNDATDTLQNTDAAIPWCRKTTNEDSYVSDYPETHQKSQKWYFSLTLPSSSVFVRAGETPTPDNICSYKNDGRKHYILTTIQAINVGEVWTIQYKSPVSKLGVEVYTKDGTPITVTYNQWNNPGNPNYDEYLVPVSYYDADSSSGLDLVTTGTH